MVKRSRARRRAELLGKRGIYTLEDLLNYLPFRYEDRIHFFED